MKNALLRRYSFPTLLLTISVPAALVFLLWLTNVNNVTPLQMFLALVLAVMPWHAYLLWRRAQREDFPVFSVIAAMYFLYYAVPAFWGDPEVSSVTGPTFEIPSDVVTQVLILAVCGVIALGLGIKVGVGRKHVPKGIDRLSLKPSRMNYIRFVLVAATLLGFSDFSVYTFGSGARQAMVLLISTIPLLAFAILFRAYLRKEDTKLDRLLIVGFLGLRFLGGMASGWLGAFTSILIICAALYIAERRRLPRLAMLLVIGFTLFFQVGKEDFRKAYWVNSEPPASRTERLMFWIDTSLDKWNEVIENPNEESLRETIGPSVNRLALLSQTGNVIDKTPRVVPYQYGKLYSYMFITFIPRFVWPDKPSVSDANQYYQVAYGLTTEENLEGVSIAVGVLTEGFMNFGWIGAVAVMFLLGIFFDFFQAVCFSKSSGVLWTVLGMVLLPQLLAVESQMAQYLGGLIQQIVFTILVMIPALKFTRKSSVKLRTVSLGYAGKQS